jgi:hypothetical protein
VLQMIGSGGMPKLPKGMKMPANMANLPQPARPGSGIPGAGKKRKKGGPWGLIKTR